MVNMLPRGWSEMMVPPKHPQFVMVLCLNPTRGTLSFFCGKEMHDMGLRYTRRWWFEEFLVGILSG